MYVTRTVFVSLSAACAVVAIGACGGDDNADADGGADGGADSTSAADSTAGDDGSVGSDAAHDSGHDAAHDAGSDGDATADASMWCGAPDGGTSDGGDAGMDAAALCPYGQWHNTASSTCVSCPTTALTCASAVHVDDAGPASPTWSISTRTLTVTLPPGTAQLVSVTGATATVGVCFVGTTSSVETFSPPVTLQGDTVSLDLSSKVGKAPCGAFTLQLRDACCTDSTVVFNATFDQETGSVIDRSCPVSDAGTD